MNGLQINKKVLIDTIITSLALNNGSLILSKLLKIDVNNAYLKPIAGGAIGFLTGLALKNSNIQTMSIGLLATNIIQPFIQQSLGLSSNIGLIGSMPSYVVDSGAGHGQLSEYVNQPVQTVDYQEYYN